LNLRSVTYNPQFRLNLFRLSFAAYRGDVDRTVA